jgi:hypothetical protein
MHKDVYCLFLHWNEVCGLNYTKYNLKKDLVLSCTLIGVCIIYTNKQYFLCSWSQEEVDRQRESSLYGREREEREGEAGRGC